MDKLLLVPMQKVHVRIVTKDVTWQQLVHLVVKAVSHAHRDMHKTLKGKHFVYPARLAATRVEKDCPRASCVLSEERQPTSLEAVVVMSAKLVAINRKTA